MASRKEEKERLRSERLERERQAKAAERRKRLVGFGIGGVLAVAAIAAVVIVVMTGGTGGADGSGDGEAAASIFGEAGDYPEGTAPPQQIHDLDRAVEAAGCELRELDSEGNEHVEPPQSVEYESNPPHSGTHYFEPAPEDAYTVAPATEALVHSLEHGRIIIQYDPAVSDDVKGGLFALYDEDPYHIILTPNETDMPYEVAATAWTKVVGCEEMTPEAFDALRTFRDSFRDEGPEQVP